MRSFVLVMWGCLRVRSGIFGPSGDAILRAAVMSKKESLKTSPAALNVTTRNDTLAYADPEEAEHALANSPRPAPRPVRGTETPPGLSQPLRAARHGHPLVEDVR